MVTCRNYFGDPHVLWLTGNCETFTIRMMYFLLLQLDVEVAVADNDVMTNRFMSYHVGPRLRSAER